MDGKAPQITKLLKNAVQILAIAVSLTALPAPAHSHEAGDEVFGQMGVVERLGRHVPLQLTFTDQSGKEVQLARYFGAGPVLLTLNYYSCPTLCPLVFRNLATTIAGMRNLTPGSDFKIVTVSIDPRETAQRAAEKSAKTYAMLKAVKEPASTWPFLRGNEASIAALAESVGVRYARLANGEFAHPNVIVIVTPKGRIARYLYGLEQAPQDLRLALLEASGGHIGGSTLLNKGILYCFHYDPIAKKYVLLASRVMTAAMLGILALTTALLAVLWKRESGRSQRTES